jgi:hypothetical protein
MIFDGTHYHFAKIDNGGQRMAARHSLKNSAKFAPNSAKPTGSSAITPRRARSIATTTPTVCAKSKSRVA